MYIQITVVCDEPSQVEAAEQAFRDIAEEFRSRSIADTTDHQIYVQVNASSHFEVGRP